MARLVLKATLTTTDGDISVFAPGTEAMLWQGATPERDIVVGVPPSTSRSSREARPTQGAAAASGNYVGSVQTQLLAGKAPDVAQLTFDALEYTATQLGAKPLSDILEAEELEEHSGGENPMHPNAQVPADWDGKTYGMPYTGKPSLDISCTVKGGNWCMQGLFKSNGAEVLSEDRTTIGFGSPEAVETVERFAEMSDAGVLRSADAAAQMEGIAKGDTAMILTTSALQGMFMQAADAGGWTLEAAAMPAFDGQEAVPTNSGSALFVLSDDPAKQRAGWELIKFLTSDRAYELISSQIGYLPLRTGLVEDGGALHDWAQQNPLIEPNLAQLDRMQPWVSYPGNSYVQVEDLLATAIEEVVYFGKPAEATMTDAADRAQALIV